MSKAQKAIIIGAGPAGLTAAYELLKKSGYDITILEESQEIGGISRTVNYKGNRIDIGGHRFFSKSKRVTDWWSSIMPTQGEPSRDDLALGRTKNLQIGGPSPEKENRVMLIRERVSRIYYMKSFFDYPISLKWQTLDNLGLFRTIKAGFSYLLSMLIKKRELSLEDFMINRFGRALYKMFFENYTEKVWGRHPSNISPEWGAQRIKGLSIKKILSELTNKHLLRKTDSSNVETSLIEQFTYPKYGPGQLWETTAEEIVKMGGRILKGCKVISINYSGANIHSVSYMQNDQLLSLEGDVFLSSMPVSELVGSLSGIDVPNDVAKAAAGLPYRDFITVGLLVDKLKLKNTTNIKTIRDLIPDCWIYIQGPDVKLGRLQIFNNWSPYMVKDHENTVWLGLEYFCNEGDLLWNMDDNDFTAFATGELEHIGVIDRSDIRDSVRIKVKKAYPAYFGTYDEFGKIRSFLDTLPNLYCIGRNGQHRYNNMDHSMLTAMEAAYNIINNRYDKSNIWSVNTEEEYHEAGEHKAALVTV